MGRNPTRILCAWDQCRELRPGEKYGSKRCRQTAYRLRKRAGLTGRIRDTFGLSVGGKNPLRLAYADPPYPGMSGLYRNQPTYRGEVDHKVLIRKLTSKYDGWALSTSARALARVLPLCPRSARVCAWVKPIGASPQTAGLHNCWEPLIVVGGRARPPGVRDWIAAQPARHHGTLIGRKPLAFAAFLFAALGAAPGDTLDDLFPGTGMISRAWRAFRAGHALKEVSTHGRR